MHKELWKIVKNLGNNKDSLDASGLALANQQLSADVLETVKDHYNKRNEMQTRLPPWI